MMTHTRILAMCRRTMVVHDARDTGNSLVYNLVCRMNKKRDAALVGPCRLGQRSSSCCLVVAMNRTFRDAIQLGSFAHGHLPITTRHERYSGSEAKCAPFFFVLHGARAEWESNRGWRGDTRRGETR